MVVIQLELIQEKEEKEEKEEKKRKKRLRKTKNYSCQLSVFTKQ